MTSDNVGVTRSTIRLVSTLSALALVTVGCGGPNTAVVTPSTNPTPSLPAPEPDARTRLAGQIAAAKDERYTASYLLTGPDNVGRTVTVVLAQDGSWRVDIPGGARGGTVDVSIAGNSDGVFQCTSSCVWVAAPGEPIPAEIDPRVHHLFTDWLDVLLDRQAALSVAPADPLPGSQGTCYSVEPTTVSLTPPMDSGIYCYLDNGVLTAAQFSPGVLVLIGEPGPAPESVALPAPIAPAGTSPVPTSPPPPSPTPDLP